MSEPSAAIGAGVVWLLWLSEEDRDRQNREISYIRSELWKLQSATASSVPMQG
jgi:hypothetical protein